MTEVASDTLVDGRYRILSRIGSGGMADVYAAEDIHLGRQVALKVLHRRFAQDQSFVERFRREASAAAGLQHPNVVSVFDRGHHDGTYYIAMEHLGGRTLKEVIREEAPFDEDRAIALVLQVLAAAGFAHRRAVIHRDFKPHNVMLDAEGTIKVTDFGIARAGASEMTETGSIMGTAQYLSPEQAQGRAVTAASDLYSIGAMLYEMLSGRLPFDGDSAVSIAVKHVNEQPPPLSAVKPDIHPAVEAVVMRALSKDPHQRYTSAEQFAQALESARTQAAADPTGAAAPAAFAVAPVPVSVAEPAPAAEPVPAEPVPAAEQVPAAEPAPAVRAVPVSEDEEVPVAGPPPEREDGRRRARRLAIVLLPILLLIALGAFLLTRADYVLLPNVVGQPLPVASAALERAGLHVVPSPVRSNLEPGRVLDQDPDPSLRAEEGSTVRLLVSEGPGARAVPVVAGLAQEQAVKRVNDAGFRVDLLTENSDQFDKGIAIRTDPPAGAREDVATRIRLFVSAGPVRVRVPNVVGLSQASAEARLEAAGLFASVDEQGSEESRGRVLAQDPDAGTRATKGDVVTISVSLGPSRGEQPSASPATASVPSVTGLSEATARAQLQRAGFGVEVRERTVTDEADDGRIVDQSPASGIDVGRGSSVVIVVGRLDPGADVPSDGGGTTP